MNKNTLLKIFIGLYLFGGIASIFIISKVVPKNSKDNTEGSSISRFQQNSKIGVIDLNTPIYFDQKQSSLLMNSSKGAEFWLEQIEYAITNMAIKAVILRVNSPGGTVGASQELHDGILRIKEAKKPVVVSVGDIATSGAYYASVGADRIFANAGSVIGSIGVIIGGAEYSKLLEKFGVTYQAITSGKNKDILSPYKAMTDEQRNFLKGLISDSYEQFLEAVVEGRKMPTEEVRLVADGSIFTGNQALQNGLIDQIGTFHDAIKYVQAKYKLSRSLVGPISPKGMSSFSLSRFLSSVYSKPLSGAVNISLDVHSLGCSPVLYLYKS